MDTIQALRQLAIFKDLPERALHIVAGVTGQLTVAAGETIVSTAHAQEALYSIHNGTVQVVPNWAGAPPVLFGPGETIGDVEFVGGEPPLKGTWTALERVDLLVIPFAKLTDALAHHPEVAHAVYRGIARSLAGRLRRAVAMLALSQEREQRA